MIPIHYGHSTERIARRCNLKISRSPSRRHIRYTTNLPAMELRKSIMMHQDILTTGTSRPKGLFAIVSEEPWSNQSNPWRLKHLDTLWEVLTQHWPNSVESWNFRMSWERVESWESWESWTQKLWTAVDRSQATNALSDLCGLVLPLARQRPATSELRSSENSWSTAQLPSFDVEMSNLSIIYWVYSLIYFLCLFFMS